MKKTLALVLALAMVLSLAVPAFAENTTLKGPTETNPVTGTSEILTSETKSDGTSAAGFEVNYPAKTTFNWGDTVADAKITYTAKTHLSVGSKLTVSVTSEKSKMTLADNADYGLEYTLKDDAAGSAPLADLTLNEIASAEKTVYVDIPQAQWDAAPVGQYSDILTFTANVA